ncbi:MAG: DUF1549 domain-containing protein [Isosphaeraceae bacterium]|nr:DUF1549 domain-containing protein [Isosphaeraceae bacterium]
MSTRFPNARNWRTRVLATVPALLALCIFAGATSSAADDEKSPADAKTEAKIKKAAAKARALLKNKKGDLTPEQRAKAQAAIDAFRELQAAVDRADAADAKSGAVSSLPTFPPKKVESPTVDSAKLDELIAKSVSEAKAPTSPIVSDEEFARRLYLDVAGRIPTLEELRVFVTSKDKAKRSKLIDKLLASEDFAANLARYWRDVVFYRAPNPNPNQVGYPYLEKWLTEQFAANKPWDEITRDLITARGSYDENGASAFGLAQMAQPVEMAGEVSRVFMGIQIQCAQCHDHPSAPWKRDQFHEFAAFFQGIASRAKRDNGPRTFELYSRPGVARYSKPDLEDPSKSIPVTPKFFVGDAKPVGDNAGTRDRLATIASYIVAQDNPYFAQAFVNRVWASLLGQGFFNPIDDMGPGREGESVEILETLAADWQKSGYDIRGLYRVVLNTKTYQRASRSTNSAAGRTAFAANCPSRLRGDQIFDAIASALDLPLDNLNGRMVRDGAAKAKGKAKSATPEQNAKALEKSIAQAAKKPEAAKTVAMNLNAPRTRFNTMFGVDPSTPPDEVLGTIPQALFLMNSPIVNRGVIAARNTMLGDLLESTPDNRAVLDSLYYKVLSRRPTAKEVAVCARYVEEVGNRKEAFEDILWSLVNSTEFISRH